MTNSSFSSVGLFTKESAYVSDVSQTEQLLWLSAPAERRLRSDFTPKVT